MADEVPPLPPNNLPAPLIAPDRESANDIPPEPEADDTKGKAGRPKNEYDSRGNTYRDCLRRQLLLPASTKFYVSPHATRMDIIAMREVREGMAGNLKAIKHIAQVVDGPPKSIVTIQPAGSAADGQEPVSATLGWVREMLGVGAEGAPKKPVH